MKALFHLAIIAKCLALLVWTGGMVFFAFCAAPLAFQAEVITLTGGTHVSGLIVNAMLTRFTWWQAVCAAVLIAALVEEIRQAEVARRRRWAQLLVALAMTGLLVWYGFVIGPRMRELRAEIGDFNAPAAQTSPQWEEFDALHRRYVRLMSLNLLLGVSLFAFAVAMIPSAHRDRDRGMLRSIGI